MKKICVLLALGIVLVWGSVVMADGEVSLNGWPVPGTEEITSNTMN